MNFKHYIGKNQFGVDDHLLNAEDHQLLMLVVMVSNAKILK